MEQEIAKTDVIEKEPWTLPILKKMNIEETALGGANQQDGIDSGS